MATRGTNNNRMLSISNKECAESKESVLSTVATSETDLSSLILATWHSPFVWSPCHTNYTLEKAQMVWKRHLYFQRWFTASQIFQLASFHSFKLFKLKFFLFKESFSARWTRKHPRTVLPAKTSKYKGHVMRITVTTCQIIVTTAFNGNYQLCLTTGRNDKLFGTEKGRRNIGLLKTYSNGDLWPTSAPKVDSSQ